MNFSLHLYSVVVLPRCFHASTSRRIRFDCLRFRISRLCCCCSLRSLSAAPIGSGCVPSRLADIPGRANLRSAERGDLRVPSTTTVIGRRSFRVAAPTVWNSLPPHLRVKTLSRQQFRAGLKTYLFKAAYR